MRIERVRGYQTGDTIIEVLFAITIFSLVAIAGLSIMNQGTTMAQRTLEIGLVRQQIDSQADALRYISKAHATDPSTASLAASRWDAMVVKHEVESAVKFEDMISSDGRCQLPSPGQKPFALNIQQLATANPRLALSDEPATYAKVSYDTATPTAEGIWIQAVRANPTDTFYDFHIRACWEAPGQTVPVTMGTIVRLYEP